MLTYTSTFSSFSVDNIDKAKDFYGSLLGLAIEEQENMGLHLKLDGGNTVFMYPKDNHVPASYTVLNFVVDDIDAAVDDLASNGVVFEHYSEGMLKTDEKGIARAPELYPDMAWFKDPAGNFLALLKEKH